MHPLFAKNCVKVICRNKVRFAWYLYDQDSWPNSWPYCAPGLLFYLYLPCLTFIFSLLFSFSFPLSLFFSFSLFFFLFSFFFQTNEKNWYFFKKVLLLEYRLKKIILKKAYGLMLFFSKVFVSKSQKGFRFWTF